ncbi:CGNR zinc finger domain-containing protein [Rhodovulum sp. DZ06]|uniref:CGNR zinc finger domain-containing protein n=1 Tax=Rhodovulum sp. DZ06 TaxID=3425126 RepID=UPI003D3287E2
MTDDTRSAGAPRPDPFLVADHPALDFLNSVAAPWGEEIEWIETGADLTAWMVAAGLLSREEAEGLPAGPALDAVAAAARGLRDWFRGFVAAHAGRGLDAEAAAALGPLNEILARDAAFQSIVPAEEDAARPGAPSWLRMRRWRGPDDLLLPIAEAMGELICDADFKLVKNCEGPSCTLWFLDTTRNHKRRWCTMAVCGNRAKAAAFRARRGKAG